MRQILTESILLSCCGALLGAVLALAGTQTLSRLTTFNIPLLSDVHLNMGALLFTLLLAVLTGVVFGLAPALQAPKASERRAQRQHRGSTNSRKHAWIRGALVVSEIVFACVLMVGTGLLLRSFLRVLDVNLGFQPAHAAAMRIDPSARFSTPQQMTTYFK